MNGKDNLAIFCIAVIVSVFLMSCQKEVLPVANQPVASEPTITPTSDIDAGLGDADTVAEDLNQQDVDSELTNLEEDLTNW
ncbi:MAG: hypothetical protein ABIJ34_09470 [archaeon]